MKFLAYLSPMQWNTLMIFILLGMIKMTGFLRDIVLVNLFGVERNVDIYFYALIIPSLLISIFSLGFNAFFIPTYIKIKSLWGQQKAKDYSSNFFMYSTFILLFIAFIYGWFFAFIVTSMNPAFFKSEQEIQMFLLLSKWSAGFFFFFTMANFFGSLFQAEHHYPYSFYPQLLVPLSTIILIIFGHTQQGIASAVYGMTWGAFLSFLCSLFIGLKMEVFSIFPKKISLPELTHNLDQLGFSTMALVFPSLISVLDQYMASHLGEGKLTSLIYGVRIPDGFSEIIGIGIGVAAFSHFSAWAATQDREKMIKATERILIYATLFVVPLCFYLIIYSEQLIHFLFERGAFSAIATKQVSSVLRYYAMTSYLFIVSVIGTRLLSALHKNQIILMLSLVGFVTKIFLNFIFIKWLGLEGIPSATIVMYAANSYGTYYFLAKQGVVIFEKKFLTKIMSAWLYSGMVVGGLIIAFKLTMGVENFLSLLIGAIIMASCFGVIILIKSRMGSNSTLV